jgi:hypothetical protein
MNELVLFTGEYKVCKFFNRWIYPANNESKASKYFEKQTFIVVAGYCAIF